MVKLFDKTYTTEYGTITTLTKALVEEERNGLFELSFVMLNTDSLFNYIKEENIVVSNANDTLLNQKFRIYMTRKLMNNRVEVFARHISFDLMYDYIENLTFANQSCQYALNQLFRNSNFSSNYKGYSDIANAQDYKISMANILEAIGGKRGSILDTFGTGAELLRDNENIHVLNRRGNDNLVTIEYRKNLTGFELEEDTTDLVTRIMPYAKYTPEGGEETTVKADYVDSLYINNLSHPYIKAIDYSEKFEDGQTPTVEKLISYARKEYTVNKVDIPKQNFKIEFIHLSKCVGYEGLSDRISLCDTVTIKDTRYNINTKAKVIKTVFNVLKNRYESIELGEPRTSLGDIIGGGNDEGPQVGPPGPPGPPGEDGNLGDFPDSLPSTPILESFVYGFANIELRWSFENKVYYGYELYASKIKGFTPNIFDLIHEGQISSYLYQAKPNETWYFKVCAINTYGNRTTFSNEVEAKTTKIEDLSNYVDNMAIGDALIGTLSLDRGWIGQLNANLLDVKGNFSVTDGNGKRTLDIDSFGNVTLDPSVIRIGFNGINNSILIDANKMQFKDSAGNQSLSFMRGSLYAYEPNSSVFMGAGIIPRWNQGSYNAGFGVLASANSYYYSIARAGSWNGDNQANPGEINEYLTVNYRDRSDAQKQGVYTYYKLYTSGGVNGLGYDIENFRNIKCLDVYAGTWRYTDGTTILTCNGAAIASNKNWNFNSYTLSNLYLSNAIISSSSSITTSLLKTNTYRDENGYDMFYTWGNGGNMTNSRNWNWGGNNLFNANFGYSIQPSTRDYKQTNLDGVLDSINIYHSATTFNTEVNRSLEIDITELKNNENADLFIKQHETVGESGETEIIENIDMKSMLHLALYEIKKLKEEINTLKASR